MLIKLEILSELTVEVSDLGVQTILDRVVEHIPEAANALDTEVVAEYLCANMAAIVKDCLTKYYPPPEEIASITACNVQYRDVPPREAPPETAVPLVLTVH